MDDNENIYCQTNVILNKQAILYVVCVISNPLQFDIRYKLFNEFLERIKKEQNVKIITVELQNGNRPYITDANIKLRTTSVIWYKENLINIAIKSLPEDWEYVAWIDGDIEFQNTEWVKHTIEALQLYKVVQLFSHAIDMGPKKETLHVHVGFAYQYVNGEKWKEAKYGSFFHPGYGWAITKNAYDSIGGLMDFPILGSADHHMALAFIGLIDKSLNSKLHNNYKLLCKIFEKRCETHIKRNIGYVQGTILHHYHGDKVDRKYQDRWMILINNQFDPLEDLKKNSRDLWVLEDTKFKLRDDIIDYFRRRNEDRKIHNSDYKYTKNNWV
jgi:hypothetical protein